MKCVSCNADLGGFDDRVAHLAMEVMGDEYIESIWRCTACEKYTVETYVDRFFGDESVSVSEWSSEKGAARAALFNECPTPSDKQCDCAAHRRAARRFE